MRRQGGARRSLVSLAPPPVVEEGPPAPGTVLSSDAFNRADSPTLGNDEQGHAWEGEFGPPSGTVKIESNHVVYDSAGPPFGEAHEVIDLGAGFAGVEIEVSANITNPYNGLIIGLADSDDYFDFSTTDDSPDTWFFTLESTRFTEALTVDGESLYAAITDNSPDGTFTLRLEDGGVCTLLKDGVVQGSITDAALVAGTKCGISARSGGIFDTFRVKRLSDNAIVASDDFNRADSLNLGSDAQDHLWGLEPSVKSFAIAGNKAVIGLHGAPKGKVVDVGVDVGVEVSADLTGTGYGLVAGFSNRNNFFYFDIILGGGLWYFNLCSKAGGVDQHAYLQGLIPDNVRDGHWTLKLVEGVCTLTKDGVELGSITDLTVPAATKHGIFNSAPQADNSIFSVDNFQVLAAAP